METQDYHRKIEELLDPNTYKHLNRDPTVMVLRKTDALIKQSSMVHDVKAAVWVSEALPPRLYGLSKIYKPYVPLRPIISAIRSPTYSLVKYLMTLLKPHIGHTNSFVRDSSYFLERLVDVQLEPGDMLILSLIHI